MPFGIPPTRQSVSPSPHGETQTRTGDTTIFSRVLYQLSYLAERDLALAGPRTVPQDRPRCYRLARRSRLPIAT